MAVALTFREWLRGEIMRLLNKKITPPPFIIWCDPRREWRELLAAAAEGTFELWADEEHELVIRSRFYTEPRVPRVVWLPKGRREVTYFEVFALEATKIREISLLRALAEFGVEIPRDQETGVRPFLPAHALEWIDMPLLHWKENFSSSGVKETLVDDDLVLKVLAHHGAPLGDFLDGYRFPVFVRRVQEDFGLLAPTEDADSWRIRAVARLLCTEAAHRVPTSPPGEDGRIIEAGPARERALKLLERWRNHVEYMDSFEEISIKADGTTSLAYWAERLNLSPGPLSSRAVEEALFQKEINFIVSKEDFQELAQYLEEKLPYYLAHAESFWSSRAKRKVRWAELAVLAKTASLLLEQSNIEKEWQTPGDAVNWYKTVGWQVDQAGEVLFRETTDLTGGLVSIRERLRRAYLRHLDRVGTAFSELLARHGDVGLGLPYAGEILFSLLQQREPMAVVVLDALRYDLGCALAAALNRGEPALRAEVLPARAPVPSITALGMPFALPVDPVFIRTSIEPGKVPIPWKVTVNGFEGDLTIAEKRRDWLRTNLKVKAKAFLTMSQIFNSGPLGPKEVGRLVFVFGDSFDSEGHEGHLQEFGVEEYVERYAKAIRQLRSVGFHTVIIVTDHGFFHWEPEKDEIESKPMGEALWISRRAVVGYGLTHPSAVRLPVPGSDLECLVPRSINAFKTYGGLGFFHGGATLQELVIPVVVVRWPKKGKKVAAVLKSVAEVTSLAPRFTVSPGGAEYYRNLFGEPDANLLARRVMVKIVDPDSGKVLFKAGTVCTLEPGGEAQVVELRPVEGTSAAFGSKVYVQVIDADDEEILDQHEVVLKVEMDEWL